MAGKPEDVLKLPQVEVLQGQGLSVGDAVRQVGITQQSYYRWRRQYAVEPAATDVQSRADDMSHDWAVARSMPWCRHPKR